MKKISNLISVSQFTSIWAELFQGRVMDSGSASSQDPMSSSWHEEKIR
ncbi:hypothetical protein NPIL_269221, partial [Nephila pilipes]